jgi:uncharacterized protein YwqG
VYDSTTAARAAQEAIFVARLGRVGRIVFASSEGRPRVQLLDIDSGETVPVPTARDSDGGAFDNALARDRWIAVAVGYDVSAFADGSMLNPVALPDAWQVLPGAAADEVLIARYEGRSRAENEPIYLVVTGADGLVRRRASLPLWGPVGEIDGAIVASDGLWGWDGTRIPAPAAGNPMGVLDGKLAVLQDHDTVRVVGLDGTCTAEGVVPTGARFGLGVQYDERASRIAATAFQHEGVLVVTRNSVRWIPLTFEAFHPVWLGDAELLFFDYFTNVMTVLDLESGATSTKKMGRKCPSPVVDATGRFDIEELRAILRPASWSAPTPEERDRAWEALRARLEAAAPASLREHIDLAEPSVRLRAYLPDRRIPVGASKIGGRPDLASGTPWPKSNGAPMTFLAQVRLDEVAAVAPEGTVPTEGLLVVFVALEEDGMYPVADDAVVASVQETSGLKRARWPSALPEGLRFEEALVLPEPILSLPTETVGVSDPDDDDWAEFVDSVTPTAPHHRMLGYPVSIQGDDWFPDRTLLIQVDSDGIAGMSFGDGGSLQVWVSASDLRDGRIVACTVDNDSY